MLPTRPVGWVMTREEPFYDPGLHSLVKPDGDYRVSPSYEHFRDNLEPKQALLQ